MKRLITKYYSANKQVLYRDGGLKLKYNILYKYKPESLKHLFIIYYLFYNFLDPRLNYGGSCRNCKFKNKKNCNFFINCFNEVYGGWYRFCNWYNRYKCSVNAFN